MSQLSQSEKHTFAVLASELRTEGIGGIDRGRFVSTLGLFVAAVLMMTVTIQITLVSFCFFVAALAMTVRLLRITGHALTVMRVQALLDQMATNAASDALDQ